MRSSGSQPEPDHAFGAFAPISAVRRVESNRQGRIHFDHSPFADLRGSQQRGGPCPIFRVRGRVTMRLPSRRCCGGGILRERTERDGFERGRGLNPDLWTLYGEPYPGA
jgi:hypothetical protein